MNANHLIQRVEFDVKIPDKNFGDPIYALLQSTFETVISNLDKKLLELLHDDEYFLMDRLELDLGHVKRDDLSYILERKLLEAIGRLINTSRENASISPESIPTAGFVDVSQKVLSIFKTFLNEGSFPWNAPFQTLKELEEQLILFIEKGMIMPIWEIIIASRMEIYRFTHQFSGLFLYTIIHALLTGPSGGRIPDEIIEGRALQKSGMDQMRVNDWYWIFNFLAKQYNPDKESFVTSIGEILIMERPKEDIIPLHFFYKNAKSNIKKNELEPLFEKDHYVKNSGMIILHPYLERLFSHFKLLENNLFIDAIHHAIAVHILHYLVTGNLTPEEHELVFPKMILGYPLHLPVPKDLSFPENIQDEANTLLNAVIRNWSVLKNTSINGLRESFFQRDGKVIETEISYKLIVEKRGIDVLLQHLPWNISVIALPWLHKPIFVDWS